MAYDTSDFLIGKASTKEKLMHLYGKKYNDSGGECLARFQRLKYNIYYAWIYACP
jgi:hypothetical protein